MRGIHGLVIFVVTIIQHFVSSEFIPTSESQNGIDLRSEKVMNQFMNELMGPYLIYKKSPPLKAAQKYCEEKSASLALLSLHNGPSMFTNIYETTEIWQDSNENGLNEEQFIGSLQNEDWVKRIKLRFWHKYKPYVFMCRKSLRRKRSIADGSTSELISEDEAREKRRLNNMRRLKIRPPPKNTARALPTAGRPKLAVKKVEPTKKAPRRGLQL